MGAADSVNVAPIAAFEQELLDQRVAQYFAQYGIDARCHALETAADMDRGARVGPLAQCARCVMQGVLDVAACVAVVSGEGEVEAFDETVGLPAFDVAAVVEVAVAVAFAE